MLLGARYGDIVAESETNTSNTRGREKEGVEVLKIFMIISALMKC